MTPFELELKRHDLDVLQIRIATIKKVLEREFGAGKVTVRPQFRGAGAGHITVVIETPHVDGLYEEVIDKLPRGLLTDLLRHGFEVWSINPARNSSHTMLPIAPR